LDLCFDQRAAFLLDGDVQGSFRVSQRVNYEVYEKYTKQVRFYHYIAVGVGFA